MTDKPKVVVVMPAYNAAKTLHMTYQDLPHELVDLVILVDDGSSDETAQIARDMGLELFVHHRNYGYGANQKTCYREALKAGADIVVMVHPDYQYDPTLLPEIVRPIQEGRADVRAGIAPDGNQSHEAGHALVEIRLQSLSYLGGKRHFRAQAFRVSYRVPRVPAAKCSSP